MLADVLVRAALTAGSPSFTGDSMMGNVSLIAVDIESAPGAAIGDGSTGKI
jgi:hypothetical protein